MLGALQIFKKYNFNFDVGVSQCYSERLNIGDSFNQSLGLQFYTFYIDFRKHVTFHKMHCVCICFQQINYDIL